MHIQGGIFIEYTKLGNSDLNVSRICMGCMGFGNAKSGMHSWTVGEEHSREILKRGLKRGVTSFDTAAGYQCGGDRERSQRKRAYFRAAGFRPPGKKTVGAFQTAAGSRKRGFFYPEALFDSILYCSDEGIENGASKSCICTNKRLCACPFCTGNYNAEKCTDRHGKSRLSCNKWCNI